MRKWTTAVATAVSSALLVGAVPARLAYAADHTDGPAVTKDPSTDITDTYAWMSADGSKAYLVMDILGGPTGANTGSKFADAAIYAFHIDSSAKFGTPAGAKSESVILCTFSADAQQKISCWAPGNEYVSGDASQVAGLASTSGKLKVFAGLRDDPFFFNIRGFKTLTGVVHNAAGSLTFDPAGCPKVDAATSSVLVNTLKSDGNSGAGADDFAKGGALGLTGNVLSIVVAVDTTLITPSGKVFSVWASTNKK